MRALTVRWVRVSLYRGVTSFVFFPFTLGGRASCVSSPCYKNTDRLGRNSFIKKGSCFVSQKCYRRDWELNGPHVPDSQRVLKAGGLYT